MYCRRIGWTLNPGFQCFILFGLQRSQLLKYVCFLKILESQVGRSHYFEGKNIKIEGVCSSLLIWSVSVMNLYESYLFGSELVTII